LIAVNTINLGSADGASAAWTAMEEAAARKATASLVWVFMVVLVLVGA
jgi:hypothetical protein